ncbi:hypothetical protein [Streptomyces oryzae]|uniref:hypothetical protein n=1 Tax=Streptomyces oryzae TaxID=1434886 RepID=UPI001FFE1BFB|nr:hypothetical protein [Streptomyces oryzae]
MAHESQGCAASGDASPTGVTEEMLWPEAFKSTVKVGPDREIVSVYPYRNACPTSVWSAMIDKAERDILFGGYTNYFLWQEQPRLAQRLKTKCEAGCRVRFLLGTPDSPTTKAREENEDVPLTISTRIRITLDALEKMGDVDGLEHRFSEGHLAMSVFRMDDQMLVTPHLTGMLGHDSPTFHLRRLESDGVFDRFATHIETLWEEAQATCQPPAE